MTPRTRRRPLYQLTILGLLAPLALAGAVQAGDTGFQSNLGDGFFQTSPPCPLKQFPTFESIVPVPAIIDPFDQDLIPMFCQIRATKEGEVVTRAKGKFDSSLYVLDNNTGMFETFDLGSGKFNTGSDGIGAFDFDIPTELFADGFESGDVSAWSYTRADFTKKKKDGDTGQMVCSSGASK